MSRWLPQLVLWISALGFGYFGVVFLWDPAGYASKVDLVAATPSARAEVRAMYGGLELALAAFLATCAQRPEWYRLGLLLSAIAFLGLGTGRAVGLALEGVAPPLMRLLLASEVALAGLALWAMRYTAR
jgi:hypothetical protein